MRLFVALNLPKKDRERILRAARPLREAELPVRWVDLEKLHITLKFLGTVRRETLPKVEAAIQRVAGNTRQFTAELGGFGAFPTIRRPQVIWLGVHASPELRCLKQDLEWALAECGFATETRAFHPHLTLGRADEKGGAGAYRGLDVRVAEMNFEGRLQVRTVELMSSTLSKTGARYSVVSSAKLATG